MNTNYDITTLENELKSIIKTGQVSSNVFGSRPKNSDAMSEFVVVKVAGAIADNDCYATCDVSVGLFARDVNGNKNSAKLSYMYTRLVGCMPKATGNYLFDGNPIITSDFGDDYGFHSRVITFKTIIKSV